MSSFVVLSFFCLEEFMRKFEKISKSQFENDISFAEYSDIVLPFRKTRYSAGYDFISLGDFTLKPGEILKIPTGVKVLLNYDEFLAIFVRSSMGFKYNIRMCNQVGIIDSDYYSNESNDGHIWICLQNEGNVDYKIEKGASFAQGIIMKYYTVDDDNSSSVREGGIGSTDWRDEKSE